MSRPAALGSVVVVSSLEDANTVLHELSYLNFRVAQVAGDAEQKINAVKDAAAADLFVTVEGVKVGIPDRAEYLERQLLAWTKDNGASHFKDGKKSIELANGRLGLKKRPQSLEIAPDKKEADVIDAFNNATKERKSLPGWIDCILGKLADLVKGFGSVGDFITVKFSLNKTAVKKALEEKRVTAKKLEKLHLQVVGGNDEPFVEVGTYVVTPE